jgi:formylglycine-generating enzyme required for sulfatase activity
MGGKASQKRAEPAKSTPKPLELEKEIVNSIGMKLVLIPAGEFIMGSPEQETNRVANEGPPHKVKITRAFYMGAYQVKQSEYEKIMRDTPSYVVDSPDNPVEQLSWEQALEFCKKLSKSAKEKKAGREYRLPTEAEWEYACRAGTTTAFHYGPSLSSKQANFDGKRPYGGGEKGPTKRGAVKVGSYAPNAWGLYDMHGNLWEWCLDGLRTYTPEPAKDPKGPEPAEDLPEPKGFEPAALRGGSWDSWGSHCRSAVRYSGAPTEATSSKGFRVVGVLTRTS